LFRSRNVTLLHIFIIPGFSKILVGIGYTATGSTNDFEIIDLLQTPYSSQTSKTSKPSQTSKTTDLSQTSQTPYSSQISETSKTSKTTDLNCSNFSPFPYSAYSAVGGLVSQETPIVCGGSTSENLCYSYVKDSWTISPSLNENRLYAASVSSPIDKEPFSILVSGSSNLDELHNLSNSSEVLSKGFWDSSYPSLPVTISFQCMAKRNSTTIFAIGGRQDG
jgi:hypothetical protein